VAAPIGQFAEPVFHVMASPNPFRDDTTVLYHLSHGTTVRLSIYDAAGRLVRHLGREFQAAGRHEESWDGLDQSGENVAPGVYFVQLEAGGERASSRVVRLR